MPKGHNLSNTSTQSMTLHGFSSPQIEKYEKADVDKKLEELRSEHEKSLQSLREAHLLEIESVKNAIKLAASTALRDAALEELTRLIREQAFDSIPESLASLIRSEVERLISSQAAPVS